MKKLHQYFKTLKEEKPLALILAAAAFFRLLAVIFSRGYGMHDDHFLVIEAAQSWVDGLDYNNWLPENSKTGKPSGHSMLYPGIHYFLFSFLEMINITGPQLKMYIVRFLHAFYSLAIPYFGYKIALYYAGRKVAFHTGMILALLWFLPILSVRNLTEMVCIPPLLFATWLLIRRKSSTKKLWLVIFAGLLGGLALSLRLQTSMFLGGFGLVLLFERKIGQALIFGLACFLGFFLTQISDIFLWGYPFAEVGEYIRYNLEHSTTYFEREWYLYLLFVAGVLFPPVSLFLLSGFVYRWKKYLILFLPAFLFFAFHSYFPNKQERFILPAVPFIVILGMIGWSELRKNHIPEKYRKAIKYSWRFFWIMNMILLLPVSVAYTKKSRVETMTYLSQQKDFRNLLVECSHRGSYMMPPFFYLGQWPDIYYTTSAIPVNKYKFRKKERVPNYFIFPEETKIEKRLEKTRAVFPDLKPDTVIQPSFIDAFLHKLNPHNRNEVIYIYKSEMEVPQLGKEK